MNNAFPFRYVVLRHEGIPNPHFDLMFESETDSALLTWRSDRWPLEIDTPLEKLADHRRDYLDYEGPLSGDRGHVTRVAGGGCVVGVGGREDVKRILIVLEGATFGFVLEKITPEGEVIGFVSEKITPDRWRVVGRMLYGT